MSSSIFCEGCYGYQNMVPKYPKRLFQTILISGCKCLDSTPTVKIPLAGAGSGNKQSLFMCTHSVHFSLLSKLHFPVQTTNASNQRESLTKMLLARGPAPCGWMCWGTAGAGEQRGLCWVGWRKGESRMPPTLDNSNCFGVCGPKRADFWELQPDRVVNLGAGGMSLGGRSCVS